MNMRNFLLSLISIIALSGCTAASLPQYLSDKHPYKKEFFAGYDQTLTAARAALDELGWTVTGEGDPTTYERQASPSEQRIILFSEIRQTPMFVGTRYARLNVIVRAIENKTEIEIRYVTVTSLPFRNIQTYKNDATVRRIFEHIAKHLNVPPA